VRQHLPGHPVAHARIAHTLAQHPQVLNGRGAV
jgi:hypothetical protein